MRELKARSLTEEDPMRTAILAAMIVLAGCANTSKRADAPQQQVGKAVAFYSNNEAEYRQAAQRAEEWRHETYDAPAKYLNRRDETAGSIVTFGCVTN
jgi:hypothetical protein